MATGDDVHDVVVIGAGLAGMTAAYELRQFDVVVLEREDRVGGRTLSGEWEGYWYNLGAQFVWDKRILNYCRELGVEYREATGARSALYLRGRLVEAPNPYLLLLKMPLSLREKLDFALTITRLRRLADRLDKVDREALDAKPLADVIGNVKPVTKQILDSVSRSGTGLPTDEVSGLIGLGYAIHLFGGDVNDTLKGVVGGTQQVTIAMSQAVGQERVRLGCEVKAVSIEDGNVVVRYESEGQDRSVKARACVMTSPADSVLSLLQDIPEEKRSALEGRLPYADGVIVVWLTNENEPMPWDRLLTVPIIDGEFDLVSNHSFFLRTNEVQRHPRGVLATLGGPGLSALPDEDLRYRSKQELSRIFPTASSVFDGAQALIRRWKVLPLFRTASLREMKALREPLGPVHFAGDYTSQPGTPGAVGSGYYAAQSVRAYLQES